MESLKRCKGSTLGDILGFILVILAVYYLLSPYRTVNSEKNAELQGMVLSVKGTNFEPIFLKKIEGYMANNELTNSEFGSLEKLYTNYQTSVISNNQERFVQSASKQLEAEMKPKDEPSQWKVYLYTALFVFVLMLGFYILFRS